MNRHLIEQCVEDLCQKGCREVWFVIDILESGRTIPEIKGLSSGEIAAVAEELRAVMSVYRGSCSAN